VAFVLIEILVLLVSVILVDRHLRKPVARDLERVGQFAATALVTVGWAAAAEHPSAALTAALLASTAAVLVWVALREGRAVRAKHHNAPTRLSPRMTA
jgi:hypothetical protein